MALVLDTGPIVALLDASDPEHARSVAMVGTAGEDLVVPAAVLIEVGHWLLQLYGHEPWQTFVEDIARGANRLHPLAEQTLTRAAQLERDYASLDLGLVDASVIATCEEIASRRLPPWTAATSPWSVPTTAITLTLLPE